MVVFPIIKPALSHNGFWDVNRVTFDFDKDADFIITRVAESGSEIEVNEIISFSEIIKRLL